ncbi:hypothetical protein GCM10009530_31660 [Microbispora corallina]|uniref:non-specific serine/threonine protein kinase n=1 Tax=Microbispora corallina TaxID=83302 RepID=A0ABQ4G0A4_9ACTN|nr:serine/threonine-protein kinase [Microbispora corallina]GIH40504.1 hypothetical protein Mco01_35040 [Microbispora corallina]
MPEQQPRLLADRYELRTRIGRGTMGTVWRAFDRSLGREVAVKEIRHDPSLNPAQRRELRERMVREGRMAARVSHPSVATIHDVVESDGSPWIIMELVEGRSLEQVIDEEGPLPPRLVAEIGCELLGALRAAHAQGILHRDVKPSNVLVTETGRVVLTDFGIAKALGDSALTQTGMVIGSPGYTAPERARGEHTGPESDLWSLGATLYFAVEGRPAYERATVGETLAALMTETADPPTQAGPLRPVLERLLDKDHRTRLTPEKAAAMLRIVADTPAGAVPTAVPAVDAAAAPARTAREDGDDRGDDGGGSALPVADLDEDGDAWREEDADRTMVIIRPKGGLRIPPPSARPGVPGGKAAPGRPAPGGRTPSPPASGATGAGRNGAAPETAPGVPEADAESEGTTTVPGRLPSRPANGDMTGDTTNDAAGETRRVTDLPAALPLADRPAPTAEREPGQAGEQGDAGDDAGSSPAAEPGAKPEAGPRRRSLGAFGDVPSSSRPDAAVRGAGAFAAAPPDTDARPAPATAADPAAAAPGRTALQTGAAGEAEHEAADRGAPEIEDEAGDGPTGGDHDAGAGAAAQRDGRNAPEDPDEPGDAVHDHPHDADLDAEPWDRPVRAPLTSTAAEAVPGFEDGSADSSVDLIPGLRAEADVRAAALAGPEPLPGPGGEVVAAPMPAGGSLRPSPRQEAGSPGGLGTDLFAMQTPAPPDTAGRVRVLVLMGIALAGFLVLVVLAMAAFGAAGTSAANRTEPVVSVSLPGIPSARAAAGAGATPAAGLRRHQDAKGFTIDVPSPLKASLRGQDIVFRASGDPRYVRVTVGTRPAKDLLAAVRSAADRATYASYTLVALGRVQPSPYAGAEAVDWEFTYVSGGTPMHAVSRWVAAPGGAPYAIYWVVPDADWTARAGQRDAVLASFTPGRRDLAGSS